MQNGGGWGCFGVILAFAVGLFIAHDVHKSHQRHEDVAAVAEGAADDADALKKRVDELEEKVSADESEIEDLKSEVAQLKSDER